MKVKTIWLTSFICGFCIANCIISLYQDFLGLEVYLQTVSKGWADPKHTVPVALIALVYFLVMLRRAYLTEKAVSEILLERTKTHARNTFEV